LEARVLKEEASIASLSVKTLAGTWPTIERPILASQAYLTAGAGKSAVDHPQEKLRQARLNPDFQLPLEASKWRNPVKGQERQQGFSSQGVIQTKIKSGCTFFARL
jgi:hypothetical protein